MWHSLMMISVTILARPDSEKCDVRHGLKMWNCVFPNLDASAAAQ